MAEDRPQLRAGSSVTMLTYQLLETVIYFWRGTIRIVLREVREAVWRPFEPLGLKQMMAPARIVRRCLPESEAVTLEEGDERTPEVVWFIFCLGVGLGLASPVCERSRHRYNRHAVTDCSWKKREESRLIAPKYTRHRALL